MKTYIFDLEVFAKDWLVIFWDPDDPIKDNYIWIHNRRDLLSEILTEKGAVFGGFNNKHYDDWILTTILSGGDPEEVKACNDWIIAEGKNGWDFPRLKGLRKPFRSFDLRDDIADKGLSLKAIEGNLYLPIIESSVPFDLDRALTEEELSDITYYCEHDVDATVALYEARKDYIDSKKIVGNMYGIDEAEAIGLTNAKLSAKVLKATYKERDDERDYQIPEQIDESLIPEPVLNFFMQIKDESIPSTKLFGTGKEGSKGMTLDIMVETGGGTCPVTYAWGGVHGAKPAYTIEATKERLIINYDVSSLYPNSMINFGLCSRSMEDPDAYKEIVSTRLKAKAEGDKEKAAALKLVVNTVYGAMLNPYNDLADRRSGRSVCISNQLAVTELIVLLGRACSTIDFVNINTDGIMFTIDADEDKTAAGVIDKWSKETGFNMERTLFKKVIQKDVNNYIGIKTDGSVKTKGGYVSLYEGGDFKSNSLQIIHKAVVDYLVSGISPEETINKETDIFKFQNIVKTGSTYDGAYQYIDGELYPVQKVNRIYAVKDEKYGQIVKRKLITEKRRKDKESGKMVTTPVEPYYQDTTIPECPKHTYIDNENKLTVEDLDKKYYIKMAKDRINKYVNLDPKIKRKNEKIKEVVTIMADDKKYAQNIYQKLARAREKWQEQKVKKTGKNNYAEFMYYTLDDIVPVATKIFGELGLVFHSGMVDVEGKTFAAGALYDTDNPDGDKIVFRFPVDTAVKTNDGNYPNGMNNIQALGSTITYCRRYLYLLCLDIVEADTYDAVQGKDDKTKAKSSKPATPQEREEIKEELIDSDGGATETQTKAIKNGLKKLRSKDDEKYEDYVKETVARMKAGLKKSEAEDLLIEIGEKVEEE